MVSAMRAPKYTIMVNFGEPGASRQESAVPGLRKADSSADKPGLGMTSLEGFIVQLESFILLELGTQTETLRLTLDWHGAYHNPTFLTF